MKGLRDILAENNIRSNLYNRRGSQANPQPANLQNLKESIILRQRNSVSGAMAALSGMKGGTNDKSSENLKPYSFLKERNSRNCSPKRSTSNPKGIFNMFDKKLPVSYDAKFGARRGSMDLNDNSFSKMQVKQSQVEPAHGYSSHRGENSYGLSNRSSYEKEPVKRDISPQLVGTIKNQESSAITKLLNNYSSERPRNPSASRTRKLERPHHRHSNSVALENLEKAIEEAENGIKSMKKAPERKAFIDFSTYLKEKRGSVDGSIANPASYSSQKQEPYLVNPASYRSQKPEVPLEKARSTSISYSNSKGMSVGFSELKRDAHLSGLKHEENEDVNVDKLKNHFMQYISLKCQKLNKQESEYLDIETLNRNNFDFHYVIGKGGFGKVWKVCHKKLKKIYAMKEMSKAKYELLLFQSYLQEKCVFCHE